jgi:hypothetical protein
MKESLNIPSGCRSGALVLHGRVARQGHRGAKADSVPAGRSKWLRDLPFSITAAVGFIALSGVAVLNGLVTIACFNQLREEERSIQDSVTEGSLQLRVLAHEAAEVPRGRGCLKEPKASAQPALGARRHPLYLGREANVWVEGARSPALGREGPRPSYHATRAPPPQSVWGRGGVWGGDSTKSRSTINAS